jgi:hypothetical protein
MDRFAEHVSRFNDWSWWERGAWALAAIGVLRIMWMLFAAALNEKKSPVARIWAGVVLFVVTLAALTFAMAVYGSMVAISASA